MVFNTKLGSCDVKKYLGERKSAITIYRRARMPLTWATFQFETMDLTYRERVSACDKISVSLRFPVIIFIGFHKVYTGQGGLN